jgi:L-cysteine/cystine lyase
VTPQEARAAYPVCERFAYLNAGTFGPLARATAAAVAERRAEDVERGRGGAAYFGWMAEARERVRALLAAEIGVPTVNVALTRSTTDGCNIVLNGLGLRDGDEVVTTDVEHFGLLGALACSGATVRVARVRDRPAAEAREAILAEVGPRTRLLALSHVAWSTGHVLPVAELKAETELPVLVDGAQSVGAIPVDASPFDFYTVSGQKWLCTPDSLGALYVADPEALRVSAPSYFSQASYEPDGTFEPKDGAARFDGGWIAPGLLAGAEAALAVHPPWRFDRARELARRCRELLAGRVDVVTEPGHATLVTFRVDGDTQARVAAPYERGVVVHDLPGTGWLRVSCGYWNDEGDLERLVEALA